MVMALSFDQCSQEFLYCKKFNKYIIKYNINGKIYRKYNKEMM